MFISQVGEFCMLFNEQVNMSEPQVPAVAPSAGAPAAPAERSATAHAHAGRTVPAAQGSAPPGAPPGAPAGAAQHNSKAERYGSGAPDHGNKHTHKTYVRGRGQQRGGSRR